MNVYFQATQDIQISTRVSRAQYQYTLVCAALAAGGKVKNAVKDQFYGDRSGTLTDPFGFMWRIATHTEDVSSAEMQKRMAKLTAAGQTA